MSNKGKKKEEEGAPEVGLWYVSFADMITLLLSFFVMLSSFSSYSKEDLTKFEGIWSQLADYSVFDNKRANDGLTSPVDRPTDFTQSGSEQPTDSDPKTVENSGASQWLSAMTDAYSRRRVLQIPSTRLFWGQGTVMTGPGQQHLRLLAAFIRQVPCQVLIGNSVSSGAPETCRGKELDRSYAMLAYLRDQEHIPSGRIGLKDCKSDVADTAGVEGIIEITLLADGGTK